MKLNINYSGKGDIIVHVISPNSLVDTYKQVRELCVNQGIITRIDGKRVIHLNSRLEIRYGTNHIISPHELQNPFQSLFNALHNLVALDVSKPENAPAWCKKINLNLALESDAVDISKVCNTVPVQFKTLLHYNATILKLPPGKLIINYPGVILPESDMQENNQSINNFNLESVNLLNSENIINIEENEIIDFTNDVDLFYSAYLDDRLRGIACAENWKTEYFTSIVVPMVKTILVRKNWGTLAAIDFASEIKNDNWRSACLNWLANSD